MHIGILQTGRAPEELRAEHGDYDAMFRRLLDGFGFTFTTWAVLDGELPDDITAADGHLITGSRHGVYEDHPWIPGLEDFLRRAYAARVPLVGICFGHQILAQALGGHVEKFQGGWSVGPETYKSDDGARTLIAWHQDQVIRPPEGAETIASTPFCRHAALRYGDTALSFQPHPEFTPAFFRDLLVARGEILPEATLDTARTRIDGPLDVSPHARETAREIAEFFKAGARVTAESAARA
ncbi:type 1 glutamine amidotransferase [Stappia sp.]|uniref:type 1 glutamine amidotransferase n=1 Tax=Stappia sp. TaxID=1870903 RepID=UPI0032D8EEA6